MNFEEINKAMEQDNHEMLVPMSVNEIKSSHSSLRTLKKWIWSDLWANSFCVLVLLILSFKLGDHLLAQTLYLYTAFISILALLGFITLQAKILRRLKIDNNHSKQVIELFLIQIKSYFEVSKYITTGLATSFFIPIFIYNVSLNPDKQYVTDYLALNLPTTQVLYQVGWVLLLSSIVFFGGKLTFKLFPEKQIKKLERTLQNF